MRSRNPPVKPLIHIWTVRVQVRIVGVIGGGERDRVQESPLLARMGKGLKPLVCRCG